jgi:anti-sigma regulatory factor (Ser/Thr protein kinase)
VFLEPPSGRAQEDVMDSVRQHEGSNGHRRRRPGLGLGVLSVPCGPGAPQAARAAVGGWLQGRVGAVVIGDAQLLISELVTNCFRHAETVEGAPLRITAGYMGGVIHFEVSDEGADADVTRRTPSRDGSGGFGLHILDALASRWGVTHRQGTQVWFELPGRATA